MLQFAKVLLIHRQRIAQDRRWILHGIALRQPRPCRGGPSDANHHRETEKPRTEALKRHPNRQGEPQVLKGLWHSRMIP